MKYKFSLIVPCYNTGRMIERILGSMLRQNIDLSTLQVILVDDNSTDLSYRDIAKRYESQFHIDYTKTRNISVHCPGNTRDAGLPLVDGEWLFFSDHDDYYTDNVLQTMNQLIEQFPDKLAISNVIQVINYETQQVITKYNHNMTWLHGKFYNYPNLIQKYNIRFKRDMPTHEDVFFNTSVNARMIELKEQWLITKLVAYNWVEQTTSITRQSHEANRGFLYNHFNDYLTSSTDPYWHIAITKQDLQAINQIIWTFVNGYFYYMGALFEFRDQVPTKYPTLVPSLKKLFSKIIKKLKLEDKNLLNFILHHPEEFNRAREATKIFTGPIIERYSFEEFYYKFKKEIEKGKLA